MNRPANAHLRRMMVIALAAAGTITLCLAAATTVRAADQGVIVSGLQVDFGDRTNRNPGSFTGQPVNYTIDDLCNQSGRIGAALSLAAVMVESAMAQAQPPITLGEIESLPGAPNRDDIAEGLAEVRDRVCDREEPGQTVSTFTITYSDCRMTMNTWGEDGRPVYDLVLNIPIGDSAAYMLMVDHDKGEAMQLELTSALKDVSTAIGGGWSEDINIQSLGQTATIFGYDTEHYKFDYTSNLGQAGWGPLTMDDIQAGNAASPYMLGNMVSVTNDGHAWIAADAPGTDIARSFYQNLSSTVQPGQGMSFFGGMIKNMVAMLEKGMPIVTEQTVTSKVMGRTSVSGKSESHISDIRLVDASPNWCSTAMVPDGYTITDINEQIDQATANAPSQEEMAAAMQEAQEAFQGMDPADRQRLEAMGLGGMMEQMMGGAGAPAGSAGATAAASSAPPPAGRSGSSASLSEALKTDNETETAQNYLQALGYDTGGATGEMTIETTIAISQFQAEKGLEVNGEVTPQLLGVLAAEVDSL